MFDTVLDKALRKKTRKWRVRRRLGKGVAAREPVLRQPMFA
jgi:hypothetical protein